MEQYFNPIASLGAFTDQIHQFISLPTSSFDKFLSDVNKIDTSLIYHIEGEIPEGGFSEEEC